MKLLVWKMAQKVQILNKKHIHHCCVHHPQVQLSRKKTTKCAKGPNMEPLAEMLICLLQNAAENERNVFLECDSSDVGKA